MIAILRQLPRCDFPSSIAAPVFSSPHSVGNRTQKTSTLSAYPGRPSNYNANDQITTDTYDANGNTTFSLSLGYAYDFENHPIKAGR
jgi:hypothetical protein